MRTPEEFGNKIRKVIKENRIALLSSFTWGLLAHAYMMLNKFPNHDDITSMRGYGTGYPSGRWFLAFMGDTIKKWFGNYSLPWLNGIITILLLAMAVCVFVRMFDIYNEIEIILVSGIMITFPAVTCMFIFMFTSYYYAVAVLLVLISCYLTFYYKKGFFIGVLGLACATGVYQAYFMIAPGLFVLYLLKRCLRSETDSKQEIGYALKLLAVLFGTLIVYMCINKICLKITDIQMTDYQALDEMGKVTVASTIRGIKIAYKTFLKMFLADYLGFTNILFIRVLMILAMVLDFILGTIWLLQESKFIKKLYFLVLLLLFPLSLNGIYVLCPNSPYMYGLMFYSLALFWLLPIILWNGIKGEEHNMVKCLINWCMILCIGISSIGYVRYANEVYLSMDITLHQAESYYTTLITRIKSAPGYTDEMKVAYIGELEDQTLYRSGSLFSELTITDGSRDIIGNYSWKKFMAKYLGFRPKEDKECDKYKELDSVKNMPCYPDDGSIQIIDNVVIVKFSS